jgi:hypothetical protein
MTCVSVCPRFDGSETSPVSPMFGPWLLASSESNSYGGEKGPHSLQDIKPFVSHVLCEYCDGDGHVVNDSCIGSPEEVTLLIDGAGLRQPLSLAQAPGSGPHSTLPTETAEPATAAEPVDPR